jgi:hypothetical protein
MAREHAFYGYSLQTAELQAKSYSRDFPMLTYRVIRYKSSPEGFGHLCWTHAIAGEHGWEQGDEEIPAGYELVSIWRNGQEEG